MSDPSGLISLCERMVLEWFEDINGDIDLDELREQMDVMRSELIALGLPSVVERCHGKEPPIQIPEQYAAELQWLAAESSRRGRDAYESYRAVLADLAESASEDFKRVRRLDAVVWRDKARELQRVSQEHYLAARVVEDFILSRPRST